MNISVLKRTNAVLLDYASTKKGKTRREILGMIGNNVEPCQIKRERALKARAYAVKVKGEYWQCLRKKTGGAYRLFKIFQTLDQLDLRLRIDLKDERIRTALLS